MWPVRQNIAFSMYMYIHVDCQLYMYVFTLQNTYFFGACTDGHVWSVKFFNIVLTPGFTFFFFVGGKKKPLKQPKKQGANFEDVSQSELVDMNIQWL